MAVFNWKYINTQKLTNKKEEANNSFDLGCFKPYILLKKIILKIWVVIKATIPGIKRDFEIKNTSPKKEPNKLIITKFFPGLLDTFG